MNFRRLSVCIVLSLALPSGRVLPQDSSDKYFERGVAALTRTDWDEAILDFGKVIEADPSDSAAYNNRGAAYLFKRLYDRAIADFNKVIELDPKHDGAHLNRGHAYRGKGLYKQAMADFQEALFLKPADPDALKDLEDLINLEAGNGLIDQAIADCKDALFRSERNAALQKQLDELVKLKAETKSNASEQSKPWRRTDQDAGKRFDPIISERRPTDKQ